MSSMPAASAAAADYSNVAPHDAWETPVSAPFEAQPVTIQSELPRFVNPDAGTTIDLCITTRDEAALLVASAMFTENVRTDLAQDATLAAAYPSLYQVKVNETEEEITTVLLGLIRSSDCIKELDQRLQMMDAKTTMRLMERLARWECYGHEIRISTHLIERLSLRDRYLFDDEPEWIESLYHEADSLGHHAICEFLHGAMQARAASLKATDAMTVTVAISNVDGGMAAHDRQLSPKRRRVK